MSEQLSDDELEFLKRNGMTPGVNSRKNNTHHQSKNAPGFPKKTLIAMAVIIGILIVVYASVIQSLQPYAAIASSSMYKSISDSTSAASQDIKTNLGGDSIDAASQIYQYSQYGYVAIVIMGLVMAVIPVIIYYIRKNRWNHETNK